MENLKHGSLDVQLPDGTGLHFGQATDGGLRATMRLHNWNVCGATLRSGDIGFAETFIAGDWTSPDPTTLIKLFLANGTEVESLVYGTWWGSLLYRAKHWLNRNSRSGSKKNIHAHYDLGNEFYRLWLDPTMNYSSAWFEGDRARPMEEAQWAKVRRALTECNVKTGDRVLEIGCGWGALARMRRAGLRRDRHRRDPVERAARMGTRTARRRPAAR
jgi:cyclopropane-fatty-acyl-phospholipid synthase